MKASALLCAGLVAAAAAVAADQAPPASGTRPTPPPLVSVAPPVPEAQMARSPEALKLFGRLDDDRAVVFIASGPADARVTVRCPDLFRPVEIWTYLEHPTLGKNARILFYPETPTGSYRYWTVLEGEAALFPPSDKTVSLADVEKNAGACADLAVLVSAVKDIARRQGDNNGGLAERGALAVPHFVPPPGAKVEAPAPLLVSNKPLTTKERKKLTAEAPERVRRFLDDVEPIITDVERDTLLKLTEDYQRDRFVDDFWKRRSTAPDGMRTPFRDIYEMRLAEAKRLFGNINTDMGRIFLLHGPPDGMRKIDCQDIYWPLQIWYYERIEELRMSKVLLLFYQQLGVGDYRLWTPLDGQGALIVGNIAGGLSGGPGGRRVDVTRCSEYRDVMAAVNTVAATFGTIGGMKMADDLKTAAKPDVEGADRILQLTTDIPAGAAVLPIQRVFRFPELVGSRMRMELAVLLERESLTKKQIGEESFYDIDLVGEVVRDGRLVDNFRYRFDFPVSSVNGPFVPLTIERELYPGEYQFRVKVQDANRNAAALIKERLKVPDAPEAAMTAEEKAAREAAKRAVTELVENAGAPRGSLSFLPIAREIATGLIRFEARASSNDIAFTEFFLNNTRVVTKRRPPFAADLDLGELPRKHVVKVIGYSKDGQAIAQDEMILNEGREAFRIRITSPAKGAALVGAVRVVADLAVPETKRLEKVEFYVNDRRAATLYQEPFQQVVDVPKSADLGFLRVVATLEDGQSTEDLRYYNAPKYLSEENVKAVELYTSVLAKGRPVTGLKKEAFQILEDGVPQDLDGFEIVTNLPLSLGIGVDTSGSMEESIVEAQKAAVEFLKSVMTKKDRSFLVTFDNEPQLVSRFTTDRDKLAQALAGLRAQGSTALWDALVYGLYQYQGTKGRKAYVILTDGEDRSSHFTFDAALDYAKKTGVAVYFIGLRIGSTQIDVRHKLGKIARETGGTVYYVDNAKGLARIYAEINEELRSQYLLSYVPQNKSLTTQWRRIEVKMTPSNLTARTISGYYP
ncbi:MAG TPA: VWA domain-containing protein [Thermoanaerobaculia bacterium]|nr:VWA domain-containing protein [Thermoanaerobaculia bacterium]